MSGRRLRTGLEPRPPGASSPPVAIAVSAHDGPGGIAIRETHQPPRLRRMPSAIISLVVRQRRASPSPARWRSNALIELNSSRQAEQRQCLPRKRRGRDVPQVGSDGRRAGDAAGKIGMVGRVHRDGNQRAAGGGIPAALAVSAARELRALETSGIQGSVSH